MGINLFKSPYGCFYWSLPTPPGIFRHWKNSIDLIFKASRCPLLFIPPHSNPLTQEARVEIMRQFILSNNNPKWNMHKGIPKSHCVAVLTFFICYSMLLISNRVIYVNKEYKKVSGKGNAWISNVFLQGANNVGNPTSQKDVCNQSNTMKCLVIVPGYI